MTSTYHKQDVGTYNETMLIKHLDMIHQRLSIGFLVSMKTASPLLLERLPDLLRLVHYSNISNLECSYHLNEKKTKKKQQLISQITLLMKAIKKQSLFPAIAFIE